MGDHDVREALERGDRQTAHRLLVRDYYELVYGRCFDVARDRAIAEDAAQNVFIKIVAAPDQLLAVVNFARWLQTVATTTTLDEFRQTKRQRQKTERLRQDGLGEEGVVSPEPAGGDAARIDTAIRDALATLEPEVRAAFLRRVVDEAPWADIAADLGLAVDTIRMRVKRALKDIQKLLLAQGLAP